MPQSPKPTALVQAATFGHPKAVGPLSRVSLLGTVFYLFIAGCSPDSGETTPPGLSVYSTELVRDLGTVDGDSAQMFHDISDVLWGAEGSVLVADRGTQEISIFDQRDRLTQRFGGPGDGPGEFQGVSHMYRTEADSIGIFDTWTRKLSYFDRDGTFGRAADAFESSHDSVFPMDVWISGRHLVHGAPGEEARRSTAAILAKYTPPTDGFRMVVVAEDGPLWLREGVLAKSDEIQWIIVNPGGALDGTATLPTSFTPMTIHRDRVIGRWVDELGVHYVREYRLDLTSRTVPRPTWLTAHGLDLVVAGGRGLSEKTMTREELTKVAMPALREVARSQEIHYSAEGTYSQDPEALSLEPSQELQVFLLQGDTRGWVGLFAVPERDQMCGLAYGFTVPPGWAPGGLVCGS